MTPSPDPHSPRNRARRHFLGLAAAAGARAAAITAAAMAMLPSRASRAAPKVTLPVPPNRPVKCFLRGTRIMTPAGEVAIEDLRVGDLVETIRGTAASVRWIARETYRKSGPSFPPDVVPVRISRGALGNGTPHADLYLSPGHALFLDGALVRVKDLVNGTSIVHCLPSGRETIEYLHIVLHAHEVVLAEGAPAETFLVWDRNYESFPNFPEYERLYPREPHRNMAPFAPTLHCDGGRAHLKALLRLGASLFVDAPDPLHAAYAKIADRAARLPL
ncbi:Hint domain-containing protein [Sinorhizobium sp. BG8]|uniref:Hint domain-containing protein n=1 Tax=Sinorhizobium sp. BG8 TaxID=2613773 RepID=UPI00193CCE41|nr:Hint domain-containing protein [Sinorhizobium sp. BG8]QRM55930.1 Hint domain-containing protein [Sinorhizobium sp. BG8]